jgi:hypothetical protein
MNCPNPKMQKTRVHWFAGGAMNRTGLRVYSGTCQEYEKARKADRHDFYYSNTYSAKAQAEAALKKYARELRQDKLRWKNYF